MQETILINREAVKDLVKVKEEFDAIVESIELMSDKEFMNSYNKSKEQIKKIISETPLTILKKRFAQGKITKKQFEDMKKEIGK